MRIFLDANILFSASLPNSRMGEFLVFLESRAALLTNHYAAEEARRNIRAKFPIAESDCERVIRKCEIVTSLEIDSGVSLASKDVPVLSGAIAGRATYLLTGDQKDFGLLWGKTIQGVTVISPQMLAEKLLKKKS